MNFVSLFSLLTSLTLVVGAGAKTMSEEIKPMNNYMYRFEDTFTEDLVSVEAWVNVETSFNGFNGGVIFGNFYSSMYRYGDDFNIEVDKDGYVVFNYFVLDAYPVKARSYVFNKSESQRINTGLDTHLAITRTPSTISLYINGVLAETGEFTSSYSDHSAMRFQVGVDYKNWTSYPKEPLFGNIEQISLFSSVLTPEQVLEDYTLKTRVFTKATRSSTVGNWYFGTSWNLEVVEDTSENDNDAILCTQEKWVDVNEEEQFDYSLVVLPDVQITTHFRPDIYAKQMQWLVDNKAKYNIPMVNYVGDLVDNAIDSTSEQEWAAVDMGFSMLKNANIQYGFCLGNHDYDGAGNATRETTGLDGHVSYEEYASQPYFGGAFKEGSLENTYFSFTIDGVKYLYLNLEFGPRETVVTWANRLIEKYHDHRVIAFTHSYIASCGRLGTNEDHYSPSRYGYAKNTDTNDGQDLWDKIFSKHENMFMVFCGHETSDDVVSLPMVGEHGNVVHQFLVDVQGSFNSNGVDLLFIMKVNESKQKVSCYWYSPSNDKYLNIQNQFSFTFGETSSTRLIALNDLVNKNNFSYLSAVIPGASLALGGVLAGSILIKKKGKKHE